MVDIWGKKKKKGLDEDPFSSMFDDDFFGGFFGDILRRQQEMMNEMRKRSATDEKFFKSGEVRTGKPVVYGFSLKVGPDGNAVFEPFGNVKAGKQPVIKEEREPLVDVLSKPGEVTVLAELPGVEKKDIQVKVVGDDDVLHIHVPNKFDKNVKLPTTVKPKLTKAQYKNGVLEVNLVKEREEQKRDEGEIQVR